MSLLATILRPKPISTRSKIEACAALSANILPHAGGREGCRAFQRRYRNNKSGAWRDQVEAETKTVEHVFIHALVLASSCRRCTQSHCRTAANGRHPMSGQQQRRYHATVSSITRPFSATAASRQAAGAAAGYIPRQRYSDLGDTYISSSESWEPAKPLPQPQRTPTLPISSTPPNHLPLAPRLVLTPKQESRPPYSPRLVLPPINEEHATQIKTLSKCVSSQNHHDSTARKAWKLYHALPTPRPRYLRSKTIRKLFRALAWVEVKKAPSAQRYLALLEECVGEDVEVTTAEWNTAIAFAGRWVSRTTKEEVKAAVETWMKMENQGGQRADNVTFNILFDVAVRAGRFALADTISAELKARGMVLNRYFRTTMIFYAGLRRDGDGVRKAFRDLVSAGEIVDTAVMNCVILSLLRAGEPASAENVFAKMKVLHATKFGVLGPRNWKDKRKLGIQLHQSAQKLKVEKDAHESSFFGSVFSAEARREEAQRAAPIGPDNRTCLILIKYHALVSGNLGKVRSLMEELRRGEWIVHGSIYTHLFRGFWLWGGHGFTAWSREALEGFWAEFLLAVRPAPASMRRSTDDNEGEEEVDDSDETANEDLPPYFSTHLATRVVYAFYKCAGRKKMLLVWAEIQERWVDASVPERVTVESVVLRLEREDDVYVS